MASGLLKSLSLGGAGWQTRPDHSYINDYLYDPPGSEANYSYAIRAGAHMVTFWVDWQHLQGGENPAHPVPQDYAQSWAQLEAANNTWRILDEQIAFANLAGHFVALRVYHRYPLWARVGGTPPSGLNADAALPVRTDTSSPWAWFISYLMCRYKPGAAQNARGPHAPGPGESAQTAFYGNPLGASIWSLSPMNEINLLSWGRNRADATAEMIRTATSLQLFFQGPPTLLVPDMDDTARRADDGSIFPPNTYPYDTYCAGVLSRLQGSFTVATYVAWSAHNYFDVKYRHDDPISDHHAYYIRNQLYDKAWKGSSDRDIFLTEGGLNLRGDETEGDQKTKCEANFNKMVSLADIYMWTNHAIRGTNDDFDAAVYSGDRLRPWGQTFVTISG